MLVLHEISVVDDVEENNTMEINKNKRTLKEVDNLSRSLSSVKSSFSQAYLAIVSPFAV